MASIAPSCTLPTEVGFADPHQRQGTAAAAAELLYGSAAMSAGWAVDEPPAVLAVTRPVAPGSQPPIEIDLWGTKDNK